MKKRSKALVTDEDYEGDDLKRRVTTMEEYRGDGSKKRKITTIEDSAHKRGAASLVFRKTCLWRTHMIEDLFKLDPKELVLNKTKKELNLNAGVGCKKGTG
ncbi:hypothetical protein G7Y89_g5953 [Cudoniella acicularis]|uniref:Uncharacterized protein n=1 Tax=Cudoniella acicularis TaxID=354080 RepID=A0A8H4RN54_9HELO|nr:hypothetical protein G7Y89_g5953 [Cudoniella acicularis]